MELRRGHNTDNATWAPASGTSSTQASMPEATTYLTISRPQDPGVLTRVGSPDVDDWLRLYEHVSASHMWDLTIMLANILFYLNGTPRARFQTPEEEITSWDLFKEKLRKLFGNPFGHQLNAKKALAIRVETLTESYASYILKVFTLCSKADPNMSEDIKVTVLSGV